MGNKDESEDIASRRRISKVSDLKLDAALEQKSEEVEKKAAKENVSAGRLDYNVNRATRSEQIVLPQSLAPAENDRIGSFAGLANLRITTFESEIDPFEFRLLNSGHVVLFRNVWRDGNRYVQGMLVDSQLFLNQTVGEQFRDTSLANMSNLIIAFQDDVIHTFDGRLNSSYRDVARELGSSLLYRNRLTAPLQDLELIYSIQRLPPGAGGTLLGWVTLVLSVVFAGGFFTLYKLGVSQINLARQQQDFVSAVSHELKTPLTSIRMYGEMLREGWVDDDKRQTYYEYIHDESERLSRLISNVLQLASITRNDPQFDCKPVLVGELMSNIESKIAGQVKRAGFTLEFSRDDSVDNATIHIDEDCFAQIVINLVDNAIKFARNAENKTVEVRSKRAAGNRVVFSVRDFGPGVPKQQMKKIFQLFYRPESELTRETVGTGIGLAIVQQLTSAMDGSVDMVNVAPGAEFRLSFPCRPDS